MSPSITYGTQGVTRLLISSSMKFYYSNLNNT